MVTVDRISQDMSSTTGPTAPREPEPGLWGPAWVGAVVALPVYVVLQLLFVGFGWAALWLGLAVLGAVAGTVLSATAHPRPGGTGSASSPAHAHRA